jgi:predicted phosphodiesterase
MFNVPYQIVKDTIDNLKDKKILLEKDGDRYLVKEFPREGAKIKLNPSMWQGDVLRLGFVSDNHLGSNFERLDVLNLLYDLFQSEGVKIVLHGGNFIEGEARFNKNEIHKHGFARQIAYAIQEYPFRDGVETWMITGDDHEGWYNQREGINTGDYFQMCREQAGMNDIKHLGYVEADIELNGEGYDNELWCRVMHPGGGSAYAVSYAPQKIVESFQPGEKPNILMVGHYHKLSYNIIRGVHVVQMGCTSDQSIYMRKKKIEAHVGGGIIEFLRAPDGILNRCKVEFITAFDKKFYKGKDKYWKL